MSSCWWVSVFASPDAALLVSLVPLPLRAMHADQAGPWTVPLLAREAALSRSVFFARFKRALGVSPMNYLLAWRMALGKALLRRPGNSLSEVAGLGRLQLRQCVQRRLSPPRGTNPG